MRRSLDRQIPTRVSVRKLCLLGWKKSTIIFPCSFTAFRVNFQRSPVWALNLYFEKSKTTAVFKKNSTSGNYFLQINTANKRVLCMVRTG